MLATTGPSRRRRRGIPSAIAACIVLCTSVVAFAAAGNVDTSFGSDGIAVVLQGEVFCESRSVEGLELDLAGRSVAVGGYEGWMAVFRLTADGILDSEFGDDGIVLEDFDLNAYGEELAVGPDGKVVAVGSANGKIAIARFTQFGELDPSLSGDGRIVRTKEVQATATDVEILPDGGFLVLGEGFLSTDPHTHRTFLLRYGVNGMVDRAFGRDGMFLMAPGTSGASLSITGDGKALIAGAQPGATDYRGVVLRLTTAGRLDPSFSGDGRAFLPESWLPGDVIPGPDSTVVVGGRAPLQGSSQLRFAVARWLPSGKPDPLFSSDGRHVFRVGWPGGEYVEGVALQGRKVLLAGSGVSSDGSHWATARITSNGSVDTTYSPTYPSTSDGAVLYDVELSSGKIYLGGDDGCDFAVARLLGS